MVPDEQIIQFSMHETVLPNPVAACFEVLSTQNSVYSKFAITITHRIHGAGIYANIWGILMVNVTIYSIHGSYGFQSDNFHMFLYGVGFPTNNAEIWGPCLDSKVPGSMPLGGERGSGNISSF